MKTLLPCSYCQSPAEADWLFQDEYGGDGEYYSITCSNEDCDSGLSFEVPFLHNKAQRKLIEQSLHVTWNHLHGDSLLDVSSSSSSVV